MKSLAAIRPVNASDIHPRRPTTDAPVCRLVNPRTFFVDHSYQRQVGEKGHRQNSEIIKEFCWTRFKPPICAYSSHEGSRVLMVLDGQHTAIAAASHPHISKIPVMLVDAPAIAAQAAAFVGQNTDRVGVTQLQLHRASVVAGDEDALTVEQVCERAGIAVLKSPASNGRYEARQTIAVGTIRGLVDRHTAMGARKSLRFWPKLNLRQSPVTISARPSI